MGHQELLAADGWLMVAYWGDRMGWLPVFSRTRPECGQLAVLRHGEGAAYQWLARFCPALPRW